MTIPALLRAAGFEHISEREADGSWEDCTWDSGLEWYRLCFDASRPATHAEAQLLRKAAGEPPTGGSNLGDFREGVAVRYKATLPAAQSGFANLKADLRPGFAAHVQGSMKAFPSTHRLSRWDRGFDGGHAVLIVNVDGILYWCDPLAPETADVPVVVSWDEVERYVRAFAGQYRVARVKTIVKEATVASLTSYLPGYTADIKPLSNIRSLPSGTATKLRTTDGDGEQRVAIVGTVKGTVDPANGSDVWYEFFKNGRSEYTAKDNIVNLKAPVVTTTPTYPDLRSEVTRLTALTTSQKTALDAAAVKVSRLDALVAALKALGL